jgi:hypothetical protein
MPAKLRIFNSSGSSIFSGTIRDEDSVVECKIDSEICFVLKGPSQADKDFMYLEIPALSFLEELIASVARFNPHTILEQREYAHTSFPKRSINKIETSENNEEIVLETKYSFGNIPARGQGLPTHDDLKNTQDMINNLSFYARCLLDAIDEKAVQMSELADRGEESPKQESEMVESCPEVEYSNFFKSVLLQNDLSNMSEEEFRNFCVSIIRNFGTGSS